MDLPFVSIIIPVKNSKDVIERCLNSIFCLDYPESRFEVIVVDGHSSDGTVDVISRYQKVKLISESVGTRAGACNAGIAEAKGEIIVHTDADCIVNKEWLKNLVREYESEPIAGVGGPDFSFVEDTISHYVAYTLESQLAFGNFRYGKKYDKKREIYHNPGCCTSLRKDIIIKVGGYDDSLVTNEDVELDWRIRNAGYKLIYTPHAFVLHEHKSNFKSFFKRMRMYGFGRGQVFRKYFWHFVTNKRRIRKDLLSPLLLLPSLLMLSIPGLITFSFIMNNFLVLALLFFFSAGYYLLVGLEAAFKSRKRLAIILVPFLSLIGHCAYGLGLIQGFFAYRRGVKK